MLPRGSRAGLYRTSCLRESWLRAILLLVAGDDVFASGIAAHQYRSSPKVFGNVARSVRKMEEVVTGNAC